MDASAKRVYTELNKITIDNTKNPNSKKFIVDETPFSDDDSEPPKTSMSDVGRCFVVIGRVLPTSNIFNQSAFKIELKVPTEYPFKPPVVRMLTTIYHPNFGPEGKICIPILRGTESWKATYCLMDVINAVLNYIDNPNIDEAESKDIATQYTTKRAEFDRRALEVVKENLVPRQ